MNPKNLEDQLMTASESLAEVLGEILERLEKIEGDHALIRAWILSQHPRKDDEQA